jgi:hypothetical protein
MKYETAQKPIMRMSIRFIHFVIIAICTQMAAAQEHGSLRATAINDSGDFLPDTVVDVFNHDESQCIKSARTDSKGTIHIDNIPIGIYIIEMKAIGYPNLSISKVKVEANRVTDLGYRKLWFRKGVDCSEVGTDCLVTNDGNIPQPRVDLPSCLKDKEILLNADGNFVMLDYEELQRRAIRDAKPEWPKEAKPGYARDLRILIGTDGQVACIIKNWDSHDPMWKAIIDATNKWRFQPILKDGQPISAIGALEFEVPYPKMSPQ